MIEDFYNEKLNLLKNSLILNAELDLQLIIKETVFRKKYFLIKDLKVSDINMNKFDSYFNKRINGEPLSKIFKKKEFWDLSFYVNKHVLDPRPETEHIIESINKYFPNINKKMIISDFGTGSGCIIISLLKMYKNSFGIGIDISKNALKVAKRNSIKHDVTKRLKFINCDWRIINNKFDIIISNPPYIKTDDLKKLQREVRLHDPLIALNGGKNGFLQYKLLVPTVYRCMKKSSLFFLEIGYRQKKDIEKIIKENNMILIEVINDLQGIERVLVIGRK